MPVEGIPIRVEHLEGTEAGRVTGYSIDASGKARVDFELDEHNGGMGHFVDEMIQNGSMGELSLKHVKCCHDHMCSACTLVPVEVSVCKHGARPNTRIDGALCGCQYICTTKNQNSTRLTPPPSGCAHF